MAKNAAVGGTAYLKVDGKQYALRGSFVISIDKSEREGVPGMDGPHGFLEKPRMPQISAELSFTDGLSPDELRNMKDVTVTADLNNGHSAMLSEAFTTTPHEFDASEGKVSVVWQGLDGRWLS
tara:strand:- start:13704 stop:14072 length:369 start_codon:yes stop_codon:yes gene_type:complete